MRGDQRAPPDPSERVPREPAQSGLLRLLDRLYGVRDRLLASPRFRNAAAGFPLTRPIARRRARALFDLCAGFVYAQVLSACVSLRLFDLLAEGPQTVDTVAARTDLSAAAARRLLDAAVSLDLVSRRRGGRYGLGPLGAAVRGDPGIQAMVAHHALLYQDMADPLYLLRDRGRATALSRFWAYAPANRATTDQPMEADRAGPYSELMAESQAMVADDVLAAYNPRRHRHWMDVGGGVGRFIESVAAAAPSLHLTVVDLPGVAALAAERLAGRGLADRVETVGGDFHGPLPGGADIISLVRILHDHDESTVRTLLARVYAALPPGGTVLVAEPMAGTPGAEPVGDAYFGFYLWAMGSGRPRTASEIGALLRDAGFVDVRERRTRLPLIVRVLTAAKPV